MNEIPTKTIRAYKLFRTLKTRPGELFPLFIGKTTPVKIGEWAFAEVLPTKGYALRPGWHASVKPFAPQLLKKDGTLSPDRVWTWVQISADVNWQSHAESFPDRCIKNEVPVGGYYTFINSGNFWIIGGAIRVIRLLHHEEFEPYYK